MSSQPQQSNEEAIWKLYEAHCKENGSTPSLQDFKTWAKSFVNGAHR